ncbi:hypothetical protein [Nocardia sp. NPDC051570]|uniref:hypothetical protein n=1 Tax=Nocardia sp. NPDC051570 TaxID=3364324 RepID=UPI00379C5642
MIRESFTTGWDLDDLRPSQYSGRVTESVADHVQGLDVAADGTVRVAAWLARIRRV